MVTGGPGEAIKGGGGNAGAHAAAAARACATDCAAVDSGGGAGTGVADECTLCAVTEDGDGGDVVVDTALLSSGAYLIAFFRPPYLWWVVSYREFRLVQVHPCICG